jgi:methyl-accepting chemotaxis protein
MSENMEVKAVEAVRVDEEDLPKSMAACLDNFSRTFEASARRWELVVYPSLLAFIVLAAYGFFLIYTLTGDVSRLARSMESVVVSMDGVVTTMTTVSGNVAAMSTNLTSIADDVGEGSETMVSMNDKLQEINETMNVMAVPMYQIRHDMAGMNHNMHKVAQPMRMMGGIMPF